MERLDNYPSNCRTTDDSGLSSCMVDGVAPIAMKSGRGWPSLRITLTTATIDRGRIMIFDGGFVRD